MALVELESAIIARWDCEICGEPWLSEDGCPDCLGLS